MFNRDLRLYAQRERHVRHLRSGCWPSGHCGAKGLHYVSTERELFEMLGLRYITPELRNA